MKGRKNSITKPYRTPLIHLTEQVPSGAERRTATRLEPSKPYAKKNENELYSQFIIWTILHKQSNLFLQLTLFEFVAIGNSLVLFHVPPI